MVCGEVFPKEQTPMVWRKEDNTRPTLVKSQAFHISQSFLVVRLDWVGKCLIQTHILSTRLKKDTRAIRDQGEQSFFSSKYDDC